MVGERAPRARRRRWAGSVRVRTTAAAIVTVGAALAFAAWAMLSYLESSLVDHEGTAAEIRAGDIANRIEGGESIDAIVGVSDEEFVQVLDPTGDVVMASANVSGLDPLVRIEPDQEDRIERVPFEDGPFIAAAAAAHAPQGELTVIVGRSTERVAEARNALLGILAVAIPLLLVVVGVVTWAVVGRALAPVDDIRGEVDAISSTELHRRVPDPPGRDEISRLAATMNRMLERLEEGQLRQRRFVSDASHELRSPVATIRQQVELALAHPEGTSLDEVAEVVLEEDLRLQRIVEDLLLLARIDEGTLRLRPAPVDLDDIVFDEATRLRSSTGLRVDVGGVSAGRLIGDRDKLARMVRNLAENAARHATSVIRLGVRGSNGRVLLEVDDDGPGIPKELRAAVFERFTRVDDARDRDRGGTGLGLAIVAEIAHAHGGTVAVDDAPLGGARFLVALPAEGPGAFSAVTGSSG